MAENRSEWEDLTVVQLKEELEGRGLETNGRKADLIARLVENDQQMLQMQQEQQADNKEEEKEEEADFVVWADDTDEMLDEDKRQKSADEVLQIEVDSHDEKGSEAARPAVKSDEFQIDTSKEKDLFVLTWHGHKITVPCRDEVQKDLKHIGKQQNIIMYPAELTDVYHEAIRPLILVAINVSMELDQTLPGSPIKGYLRLKFGSSAEAVHAIEVMKEYKPEGRELTIQYFGDNDSEGHILSKVRSKDAKDAKDIPAKDQLIHRLMFVSNFPSDVTEANIKELFSDALRVIVPSREDASERIGYVYLEYPNEAAVEEAVTNYKNVEMNGQILYVIKTVTEKKESFGLLRDNLRKYWLEQIKTLEAMKTNPKKTARELQDVDTKIIRYKKRIDKDNRKREKLGFPVPENEFFSTPETDSDNEESKEKDASPRKDSKGVEVRKSIPPPRRRFSPPPSRGPSGRPGGSFRGGPSGYQSGRSGPPPAANSAHLMNQLQELVGALAHKMPAGESSRFGGGGYGNDSGFGGRGDYYEGGSRGGYGGGGYNNRGNYSDSGSRFGGKRPGDDFGSDRKRRPDDDYPRFGSGRGDYGGSYGGSRRGGW